jgi:hypothetical protein
MMGKHLATHPQQVGQVVVFTGVESSVFITEWLI